MIHRARIQKLKVTTTYNETVGTLVKAAQCWVTIPRLAGDKQTYGPCEMADGIYFGKDTGRLPLSGGSHTHHGLEDQYVTHTHEPHKHTMSPTLAVGDWVWVGFEGGALDSPVVLASAIAPAPPPPVDEKVAAITAQIKTGKAVGKEFGAPAGKSHITGEQLVYIGVGNHRLTVKAAAAWKAASDIYGKPIAITDSYRTYAMQAAAYKAKPNLAAPPGTSKHERGNAIDTVDQGPEARAALTAVGWGQFDVVTEPWHYSYGEVG